MKRHRLTRFTVALLALTLLTSCATGTEMGFTSTEPSGSRKTLERVDPSTITVPTELGGRIVVDPGWITRGQELDGVFVGPRKDESGHIEFIALSSRGEILWSARRPPSCTGFALVRQSDGRPVAVLTDVTVTPEAVSGTMASAYDLVTGERVWGPVDVPGPLVGPGLVFAAMPAAAIGEIGARVALDVETGEQLRHDSVFIDGYQPTGRSALPADSPYVTIDRGDSGVSVIHVESGDLVADHVSQVRYDGVTRTLLTVAGSTVTAIRDDVATWEETFERSVAIVGVGSERVYLQEDGRVSVLDIATGDTKDIEWARGVEPDPPVFLPRLVTRAGAVIITHHSTEYLVTI